MTALILSAALIVVVTVYLAVALRKMPLTATPTIVLFGLVGLIFVGGVQVYSRYQTVVDYRICRKGVERSDGNRLYQLDLIAIVDRADTAVGDELRESLNRNLPDRTLSECPRPSW